MRKRTKKNGISSKIDEEINVPEASDKVDIESAISIPKSKPTISNRNAVSAVSDSLSKGKRKPEKDLSLLHKKTEPDDGRQDLDLPKTQGWKKLEFTVDQQLLICKDYHDTGYCTFGGACKYLHTRDDTYSTSQMETQAAWKALKDRVDKAEADRLKKKTLEPGVCQICHKLLKDPVITKCGHKFCDNCAMKRYATDSTCAICGKDTEGIFNTTTID